MRGKSWVFKSSEPLRLAQGEQLNVVKLNQIIAVSAGAKSRTQSGLTELHHKLQKSDLTSGLSRVYSPKDDEGERLPAESKRVQFRTTEAVAEAKKLWANLLDVVATQDVGNTLAKADVKVGDQVLLSQVPVTHLLFLEKQLLDVRTFKLPTLDPTQDWSYSEADDCYKSQPVETTRTKKIPRNHIKYDATDKHPAQVEMYTEDIIVGTWTKTDFSSAIPVKEKKDLLTRVNQLQDAVKAAREEANSLEITQQRTSALLDYVFG
jgi:hypothetical protein